MSDVTTFAPDIYCYENLYNPPHTELSAPCTDPARILECKINRAIRKLFVLARRTACFSERDFNQLINISKEEVTVKQWDLITKISQTRSVQKAVLLFSSEIRSSKFYFSFVDNILNVSEPIEKQLNKTHLFALCSHLIRKERIDVLKQILDKVQNPDQLYSPQGTTLLTTALSYYNSSIQSYLQTRGIGTLFSPNHIDKSHWEIILEQFLGSDKAEKILGYKTQNLGSCPTSIYPLLHDLWSSFSEDAVYIHKEWFDEGLLTENILEEIGNSIMYGICESSEQMFIRLNNNHTLILETGHEEHSMAIAIAGPYIFFCNRGERYRGQSTSFEAYTFDPTKLTIEMIDMLFKLNDLTIEAADKYIYTEFKPSLDCKQLSSDLTFLDLFEPSRQQKHNCPVASLKLAIRATLIGHHMDNLTEEKLNKLHEIYKVFTLYCRKMIPNMYLEWAIFDADGQQ